MSTPYRYNSTLRSRSKALLSAVEGMLDKKRSSFAPFDDAEDARVKAAIRLYVESWLIPVAKDLVDELHSKRGGAA